jgi:methylmalonyl-CoA mutase N-terminal domain/subunit
MESYIGKVRDPAAGSNLIEEMTEVICQKSWAAFIEKV